MAKKEMTVKEMARMGGNATKKKFGHAHYVAIGKKGRATPPRKLASIKAIP